MKRIVEGADGAGALVDTGGAARVYRTGDGAGARTAARAGARAPVVRRTARRAPGRGRRGVSRGGLVGLALALALTGCSNGAGSDASADAPASSTGTPSPTVTYPLSTAPATVPAVREHRAARGPGWRPGPDAGVVVARGSEALADEGKLVAGELKVPYRGVAAARTGDVELVLDADQEGGPESYAVRTEGGRVRISGPDEAGVFYGTRTLKQAVRSGGAMPEGTVQDAPDRPQRGFMLDIARKEFSVAWMEDRLREMADLKLNQFGLHFSDDQAFRIESTTHPEVVSARHLTKDEVRRILALAKSLHITVIPEIDSPGHLGAVLAHHPDLKLKDASGRVVQGAIDIGNPASAQLVDELLREYADLFDGRYWNVGGDEYTALTWKDPQASFPALAELAREEYGPKGRVQDLATTWVNDRAELVRGFGRVPKAWNDGFFAGGQVSVDKDVEVEYWTGKEIGARAPEEYLAEGRKLVNLNDEYLYYVLGEPNEFVYPTGQRIYEQWTPLVVRGTKPVPQKYSDQILGGRFAVWGDVAGAQTPDQIARGIALPLAATAQKVWDTRQPGRSWVDFAALAQRVR